MIFNIQRFSTHDGNGIRTIIFFKGCSLRCPWCSNPEGQSFEYDIFYDEQKCIACMECVKISQNGEFEKSGVGIIINRERIKDPLAFKDICPTKAIQVVGEEINLEKLLAEIEKDKLFYEKSSGGVTFSGGEPFAQPEHLLKLAKAIRGMGISTAVETCMDIDWGNVVSVIDYIDEFLVDVKHVDKNKLNQVTCSKLEQVEHNLRKLEELKIPVTFRIPVIPGFNDSPDEMHAIIDFVSSFKNVREFHLIPYHSYGKNKYRQLGWEYPLPAEAMDRECLKPFAQYAENKGLKTVIGG